MKIKLYRLWSNGTWDLIEKEVQLDEGFFDNPDWAESKALKEAWLDIAKVNGPRPLQIGMMMADFYNNVAGHTEKSKLNIDPDWIIRMAQKENGKIVSVGGLRHE